MSAWLTSTRTSPKRFPFLAMHASYLADPTQMIGDERHQTGISVCALTVRTMTNFCDGEAAGAAVPDCSKAPVDDNKQRHSKSRNIGKSPRWIILHEGHTWKADLNMGSWRRRVWRRCRRWSIT